MTEIHVMVYKSWVQKVILCMYEFETKFVNFAAFICLFGGSYQLYTAICCTEKGNCLTEKENHTLCLKSNLKSINLQITKV